MSNINDKYSLKDISNMKVLFNSCMENARKSLTKWLKMDIHLELSDVMAVPFNEVPFLVGKIDEEVVAVLSNIMGEIEGSQLFIYPKKDAQILVNVALDRGLKNKVKWEELECSILEETSNIVGSSFINALVKETNVNVFHEPPVFGKDMLGSIMQSILSKYAMGSNDALLIMSDFLAKDLHSILKRPLKIFFFILPDRQCFQYLKKEFRGSNER